MSDGTHIEWTDATANFLNGCSVLSPGCTNCYAMRLAGTRLKHHPSREALTADTKAGPVWTGEVRPFWKAIADVLSWTRPRTIFWNAHGDIFHENVPTELIDANVAAIALTPQHEHQLLTKRSQRMRAYWNSLDREGGIGRVARLANAMDLIYAQTGHRSCAPKIGAPFVLHPLPNLWQGISAEDQKRFDERTPDLLGSNVAVRWISAEPLLGPIDMRWTEVAVPKLDWVVVGGESGPSARPMHPDWARSLRDQCAAADVPFLFKQWGEWAPVGRLQDKRGDTDETIAAETAMMEAMHELRDGSLWIDPVRLQLVDSGMYNWANEEAQPPGHALVIKRLGKKRAGRLLDGVQHDGYPA